MKKFLLDYTMTRREDGEVLYERKFIYTPDDAEGSAALKRSQLDEVNLVHDVINEDLQRSGRDWCLGHARVAGFMHRSWTGINQAVERKLFPSVYICESKVDLSTNYIIKLVVSEYKPKRRRGLFYRIFYGDRND